MEKLSELGQMKANREAFGETLVKLGAKNPKLVVFDADVCTSTMTCLFRDAFPERFIQMGVAEQNMVSAAAGLSTVGGLIPWVSTFAVFASKRALDQVSISVAYPKNNVKINGSYGGIPTGNAGATHQAVEDIAVMRAVPNMVVVVPVDAVEVEQVMEWATEYRGPVYLRTTRHKTRVVLDRRTYRFEVGKAVTLREGRDVTLMGTGVMSVLALDSAEALARDGIDARVLHMPTIKPFDSEAVRLAAAETEGMVTMENHSVIGGLGGAVAEVLAELGSGRRLRDREEAAGASGAGGGEPVGTAGTGGAIYGPDRGAVRAVAPLRRLGFPDVFGESGDDETIFRNFGLSVENVVKTAKSLLRR